MGTVQAGPSSGTTNRSVNEVPSKTMKQVDLIPQQQYVLATVVTPKVCPLFPIYLCVVTVVNCRKKVTSAFIQFQPFFFYDRIFDQGKQQLALINPSNLTFANVKKSVPAQTVPQGMLGFIKQDIGASVT